VTRIVARLLVGAYIIVSAVAPLLYGQLLIAGLLVALIFALVRNPRPPRAALFWVAALVGLGVVGTLVGLLQSDPGAVPNSTIYILEPLLLGVLLPLMLLDGGDVRFLVLVLDGALVGVAVAGVLLYLHLPLDAIARPALRVIDLSGGTLRTNYQGYNSFAFLAPYGLARGFISDRGTPTPLARRVVLVSAALSGLILAGRHILYLEVPAALVYVAIVALRARPRASRVAGSRRPLLRIIAVGAATIGLGAALNGAGVPVASAIGRTLGNVTLSDPTGTLTVEAHFLTNSWLASPIIGQGSGAIVMGYSRSPVSPWQFELTYLSLLMQFGLIGVAVLSACTAWVVHRLGKLGRSLPTALAFEAGFIGVLLASLVDPYLFTSDGIWMFFVPLALAASPVRSASSEPPGS
jgi:hypothetical protein